MQKIIDLNIKTVFNKDISYAPTILTYMYLLDSIPSTKNHIKAIDLLILSKDHSRHKA